MVRPRYSLAEEESLDGTTPKMTRVLISETENNPAKSWYWKKLYLRSSGVRGPNQQGEYGHMDRDYRNPAAMLGLAFRDPELVVRPVDSAMVLPEHLNNCVSDPCLRAGQEQGEYFGALDRAFQAAVHLIGAHHRHLISAPAKLFLSHKIDCDRLIL
ncbi:hypothetical protein P691DRAFT_781539 [Macrolepiota fuliginosa MF-IS2]|uniref:Uncharacterized protein n=1 Tax=Macrolepiota fuliginosa MF-IS2 TaxID=1400762 RepID=A0A9P6C430_9AGAR|nr:hypothetical protein P691DRAFT_781539 [Macrolepiota fuliginosa MF-IS2]